MSGAELYVDPAQVARILRDLCEAADGEDLATVVPPLCRAAAAVYAHFEHRPALPPVDRHALLTTWRLAESAARTVLPPAYCEGRGSFGFAGVFGLLYGSGDGVGLPDCAIAEDQMQMLVPMLRIFVNDLDSICAALALERVDPGTKLLAVLLGVPYSPEFEPGQKPGVTRH